MDVHKTTVKELTEFLPKLQQLLAIHTADAQREKRAWEKRSAWERRNRIIGLPFGPERATLVEQLEIQVNGRRSFVKKPLHDPSASCTHLYFLPGAERENGVAAWVLSTEEGSAERSKMLAYLEINVSEQLPLGFPTGARLWTCLEPNGSSHEASCVPRTLFAVACGMDGRVCMDGPHSEVGGEIAADDLASRLAEIDAYLEAMERVRDTAQRKKLCAPERVKEVLQETVSRTVSDLVECTYGPALKVSGLLHRDLIFLLDPSRPEGVNGVGFYSSSAGLNLCLAREQDTQKKVWAFVDSGSMFSFNQDQYQGPGLALLFGSYRVLVPYALLCCHNLIGYE
eukprot:SAG31_NODE_2771_length_5116_cov_3.598964_5_plen_341_part_00